MIVVAIIGLLLGIALPSFVKVRKRAQAAAFVSSLRVATDAFTMRAAEVGQFPPDGMPGGDASRNGSLNGSLFGQDGMVRKNSNRRAMGLGQWPVRF